jgi:ATP-dependent Clp protease ATP-binding subunit ClpC
LSNMNNSSLDLKSKRANAARLGRKIGKNGDMALLGLGLTFLILAIVVGATYKIRLGIILLSPATLFLLPAIYYKRYLAVVPTEGSSLTGKMSVDVLARLKPSETQSAKTLWDNLSTHWQSSFILHHLYIQPQALQATIESQGQEVVDKAYLVAERIAEQSNSPVIELGFVIAGLILATPNIDQTLIGFKISSEDVLEVAYWLSRALADEHSRGKQDFGGVGRDWAFGFTPLLNRLGLNVSLSIEKHGTHFGALTESAGVLNMEAAFNNGAHAVALVGPVGIGKTNSVYAFAQRLIEGKTNKVLAYHQVISLNATDIISRARGPGELEHIMLSVANEASHAGHVILFFDDAEQFFSSGPGGFDGSQILQTIIQSTNVPLIIAMTPNGYQRLRSSSQSLAGLLTPVILQEPSQNDVIRILEDSALNIEARKKLLVTFESLAESYRLSGRYEQDEAYPGKAIKLLEQAATHSNQSVLTSASVQMAIEQSYGVKVGSAAPAEASELLSLEDKIHERMINQVHAVSVVANSLRRARAGVTNPKRPIGSFLFLGPTGVGKTELAKALAATYFKSETSMIRLDMSEYQQPADVNRLLSDGKEESKSLIMAVRQQPFSVVLLDEIEKAHPNILNLLLQLLDEGQLTDVSGRAVSFKDCVIIATSNAGAQSIRENVTKGESLDKLQPQLLEELINGGQFKPELINRFDEVVLFGPLKPAELLQVVTLMMGEINQTLATQHISVSLTQAAAEKIVEVGYDPRLGARPMRRTLQKAVEDTVAQKILRGEVQAGAQITLDVKDLTL